MKRKNNGFFFVLLILLTSISNTIFAQIDWAHPDAPPKSKKKRYIDKPVAKFPQQFHSSDTIKKTDGKIFANNGVQQPKTAEESKSGIVAKSYDSQGNEVSKSVERKGNYKITTTTITVPQLLNKPFKPDTINRDSIQLYISKARYRLMVYYKGKYLTSYKCVFGSKSLLPKEYEGDKRTPEGQFKITNIKPHAEWTNFMLLDYPNADAYKHFEENKKLGKIPANASIGGSVGIHGIWKGGEDVIDKRHNWTDGCIALKNKDIAELAQIVQNGTVVNVKK